MPILVDTSVLVRWIDTNDPDFKRFLGITPVHPQDV
jgi:hypothetical protein